MKLVLLVLSLTGLAIAARQAEEVNLPEYLWTNAKSNKLKDEAYVSTFVAGIAQGTLSPNYYAKYYVQDAYWVLNVGYVWKQASEITKIASLREFGRKEAKSWTDYAEGMFKNVSVGEHGVTSGKAAAEYLEFIKSSIKDNPANLLVATYPCEKLWPYLQNRCSQTVKNSNAYAFWCTKSEEPEDQERLIREYYKQGVLKDKAFLLKMFLKGMKYEVDFFNGA